MIIGISVKATVIWKQRERTVPGFFEGYLNDNTQISTLTVLNPEHDLEYTCVVTSGHYTRSDASKTVVSLDIYCEQLKLIK